MANLQSVIGGISEASLDVVVHTSELPNITGGKLLSFFEEVMETLKVKYGFKYVHVGAHYDEEETGVIITGDVTDKDTGLIITGYVHDKELEAMVLSDVEDCCKTGTN